MTHPYDVLCISTIITDVLGFVGEDFLIANNLLKGFRSLVDYPRSEKLYRKLIEASERIEICAGGAGANTLCCFSSMGGKSAFSGPYYEDDLGKVFKSSLRTKGVNFLPLFSENHNRTARCLIFITPDSERTMQTHLGASNDFGTLWDPEPVVSQSKTVLLEAYFFDNEKTKAILFGIAQAVKRKGGQIAFTGSDPSVIRANREEVLAFIHNYVDIFISNRPEMEALLDQQEANPPFYDYLKTLAPIVVMTKNKEGSVIISGNEKVVLGIAPQNLVVDSTGAGDAYAAGFLYGLTNHYDLESCGKIATLAAAEIISTLGAHPKTPLDTIIHKRNFSKVPVLETKIASKKRKAFPI